MYNQFLENGKEGKNNLWRYVLSFLLILIGISLSGVISLAILVFTGLMPFNGTENLMLLSQESPLIFYFNNFMQFLFALIFLFIAIKYIHKRDFISLINFSDLNQKSVSFIKRIRWKLILIGIVVWFILLLITLFVQSVLLEQSIVLNLELSDFAFIFGLFVLAIPIQITVEELIFRGYLFQGLNLKIKSPLITLLITSVLFGIMHAGNAFTSFSLDLVFSVVAMPFLIGIIFSLTTLVNNGIEFGIGAHLVNNFFALALFSSSDSLSTSTLFTIVGGESDPFLATIIQIICTIGLFAIIFLYKKEFILKALKGE